MDYGTLRGLLTLLILVLIIIIFIWAYSKKRKPSFDAAAKSILDDDDVKEKQETKNNV